MDFEMYKYFENALGASNEL